ncbi:MAG: ribose 5-phosphate isomerase A [Thaumarchaeota archaeon]|nr:ribose 5-phosphate isomerase A [Nitrososphaerota archaeon]
MEKLRAGLRGVAESISSEIKDNMVLGLGSGSTVAMLLEELSRVLVAKGISVSGVPTSTQIEIVASRNGISIVPFSGSVDFVVDGADQVDAKLNLIKGGGGALLKEKVLMGSGKKIAVVAGEEKFAPRLCSGGVRVPVEVVPFARATVKDRLSSLGGDPQERLLPKGYPQYTENGNLLLDTGFKPLENPQELEVEIKKTPGVVEVGIFTIKPITVYRVRDDGGYAALK